ncbi:hypothetical protein D4R51_02020 [bacterium]|nr:MAG: hypothetical protein D4R51_02020 [bacterium]
MVSDPELATDEKKWPATGQVRRIVSTVKNRITLNFSFLKIAIIFFIQFFNYQFTIYNEFSMTQFSMFENL